MLPVLLVGADTLGLGRPEVPVQAGTVGLTVSHASASHEAARLLVEVSLAI